MSIMRCDLCGKYEDTDFESDGLWPEQEVGHGPDCICAGCVSELSGQELTRLGYDWETMEPLEAA